MRELRPFQQEAMQAVLKSFDAGNDRVLISLPTGVGKGTCGAWLVAMWPEICESYNRPERCLWLAHRDELVWQGADDLNEMCGYPPAVEKGEQTIFRDAKLYERRVVVSSVQTLARQNRREKFGQAGFGLVLVDECFVAGTMVDGRPIESIRPGDMVTAYDADRRCCVQRRVVRTICKRPTALLRLTLSDGRSLVCTPNHKIWIPALQEYRRADILMRGDMVLTTTHKGVRDAKMRNMWSEGYQQSQASQNMLTDLRGETAISKSSKVAPVSDCRLHQVRETSNDQYGSIEGPAFAGSSLLLERLPGCRSQCPVIGNNGSDESQTCVCQDDSKQSHVKAGSPGQSIYDAKGNGLEACDTRREWTRPNSSRTTDSFSVGLALQCGSENQHGEGVGVSALLQDRCRQRRLEDCDRGRRPFTRQSHAEGTGREKASLVRTVRLDSIEVLEPDDRGHFGSVCSDGLVYNLEVEEHHNYFAEGILVSNCHHAVAESWTEVINYFGAAKICGLTATCDRNDEISLGRMFQDVAYHYELLDAINDGWLSPIDQQFLTVEGIDFSKVGKDANGDISATDIGRIYREEDVLHRVIAPTVKYAGDRQTILFAPTVASAEAFAVMLERYGKTAVAVSGRTPDEERRDAVEKYKDGRFQYLVNCALYLEGFNAPATSCIVIARSTNSRMLYAQMLGRGMRGGPKCPIPGKTNLLVLDLVGASLKHKLVHAADLLGGKYDEVVIEAANQAVQKKSDEGVSADVMAELLAAAAKADELKAAQRRKILAEAKVKAKTVDPFLVFSDIPTRHVPEWWTNTPATIEQCEMLENHGIKVEGRFSFHEARQLQQEIWRRERDGLCNYKQARQLNARGFDPCMSATQARKVVEYISKRPGGWAFLPEDGRRRAIRKKEMTAKALAMEHNQ